jgi:peptide/nickel transport system permease protein
VFLVLLIIVAAFTPLLAPYDPNAQELLLRLKAPSGQHWLGTDEFGRDILSRLMYGARVSMLAAAEALVVAAGIGAPLGMVAGYAGKKIDAVLGRFFDGLMSIPALILALTMVAVLGPGLTKAMFAVGVVFAPRYFRVARAVTLDLRKETFIEASEAIGASPLHTVLRHVVPNIMSPLVIQASVLLGTAVTAEASLSFLGLGVRPPTASWGSMLSGAYSYMSQAPLLVIMPGLMIGLTVLGFTLVGDGLRGALGQRTTVVAEGV